MSGSSAPLDLRRLRLRLTLQYALLSALVVLGVTLAAVRAGEARVRADAEREGERLFTQVAVEQAQGADTAQLPALSNTWLVDPAADVARPLGDTWVEPPLFTLAERAIQQFESRGSLVEEFRQNDVDFLGYAAALDPGSALVTAIDLTWWDRQAAALRRRLVAGAGAGWIAAVLAGWFLAGRSLAPARRALGQQRDFIADAAHELRTPLAVIQAASSQALSRDRAPADYRDALHEIHAATERAGEAVGGLLDLARFEAGQAAPRLAPLRLDLLVEEVVQVLTVAARSHEEAGAIEAVTSGRVVVEADANLLRQAVENVARNAVVRAATTWVGVRVDGREAVVEVTDDGPGFAEAALPEVFDRFRRGDRAGAAGLGMAIARSIVEAHGGTVAASNRSRGGARVTLRLPYDPA